MADQQLLHATCVSVGTIGLLLTGPPGAGKSDLALRLIDQPGLGLGDEPKIARLVADDQVILRRDGDRLLASAPPALAGQLEIRGLGIMRVRCCTETQLAAVIRLAPQAEIERLPDLAASRFTLLGLTVPLLAIDPAAASAPARIRAAADWLSRI